MRWIRILGATVVAALALAACGGGGGGSSSGASATVGVKTVDGVGDVLVDSGGKALYAADAEADGSIRCVDACESFWKPLTIASGMPKAANEVGTVGVIMRPDGSRQVTVGGMPLYTFADDSAGQIKGIGFQDDFGGRHFTWDAMLAGGGLAPSPKAQPGGDGYDSGGIY
jgi:predicted lipoprotein with Yx(FWY)xxD motif